MTVKVILALEILPDFMCLLHNNIQIASTIRLACGDSGTETPDRKHLWVEHFANVPCIRKNRYTSSSALWSCVQFSFGCRSDLSMLVGTGEKRLLLSYQMNPGHPTMSWSFAPPPQTQTVLPTRQAPRLVELPCPILLFPWSLQCRCQCCLM